MNNLLFFIPVSFCGYLFAGEKDVFLELEGWLILFGDSEDEMQREFG